MYIVRTYITTKDILDKLSDEDKEKGFNRCICLDVRKDMEGTVQMTYALFKDNEEIHDIGFRQKYDSGNIDLYYR